MACALRKAAISAAVATVAVSTIGCGESGSGGSTPAPTPSPSPSPPTPPPSPSPPPEPPCSDEQKVKCKTCVSLRIGCQTCEDGYVVDTNSSIAGVCVASCIQNPKHVTPPGPPSQPMELNGVAWPEMCIDTKDAHFFGIGDWGGDAPGHTWPNPSKTGRPQNDADVYGQKYVAQQMAKLATSSQPDYVLNVGDNFYPGGLSRGCGENAHDNAIKDYTGQFGNVHDKLYEGDGLTGKPWLSVLGNHDYGGLTFSSGWDAQIYRTWVTPEEWIMPGQYWSQRVSYTDFAIDYFFMDSNHQDVGTGPGHDPCTAGNPCWNITTKSCPAWLGKAWSGSVEMLRNGIKASTADYRIIVTHFPGPSIAGYPEIQALKDEIDLIFTGHTHWQQFGSTGGVNWIISGGGGGVTSDSLPSTDGHDNAYGFTNFVATRKELRAELITWSGVTFQTQTYKNKDRTKAKHSGEVEVVV
eukprot:TRINITY_DN75900_c0_g1_i1.p1 TRINITY_DN75900_c0_g1~~TRINITY_DN75900_c0_g1_i1.p1  ORF type:complete len:467 (+),score=87.13 TRINITY_DN75900_c0_g1_i1:86-1486(+)